MERVAFQDPFDGKPDSPENSVRFYRFYGILRTGWEKAAAVADKRADSRLIKPQKKDNNFFHNS